MKKKRLFFWLVYLLVILLFQEVLFRWLFPLPELRDFNRSNYMHPPRGVAEIAPLRYECHTFQSYPDTVYRFAHHLNGYGFRDKEWRVKKTKGKKRIVFIGDSFVEGAMAKEENTMAAAFQEMAGTGFEIMNAGISGAGIPEYTKLINDIVPLFSPDEVFLVLFSNDIRFRTIENPGGPIMKKHFSKWVPRLFYLFEMLASNEPLPFRWKKAGSFIPAVPSPENIWTEHEADLAPHVAPEIAKHMKEGNFNVYRINYVAADEKYLKEKVNLEPWLESVKTYLSKHGAQLNVCYIPGRSQVTSFYYQYELHNCRKLCPPNMDLTGETYQVHRRDLDTLCRKIGIPFIDLTPTIKKEEDAGNRLFWSYDDHLRDVGYRLVGKTIYQHWTQQ